MTLPAPIAIVSGVTNVVRGAALQAGCASSRDHSLFYELGAICYLRFRVTQLSKSPVLPRSKELPADTVRETAVSSY